MLLWVGSCQAIKPVSISTAVISPIELLKIIKSSIIIKEFFVSDIAKESSVWKFHNSDPSSIFYAMKFIKKIKWNYYLKKV